MLSGAKRVAALVAMLSGCSLLDLSTLKGGDGGGGQASGMPTTTSGGGEGGTLPTCVGEDCSLHGQCVVEESGPRCICDGHFGGLRCERCAEGYAGESCLACDDGFQDKDDDGTCLPACTSSTCSGNGVCRDESGALSCTCFLGFQGAACETPCAVGLFGPSCDFKMIYGVDLPARGDWNLPSDIGYDIDEASAAPTFTRVAYRLALDDEQVWVEMDAFTTDASRLGVPIDFEWDIPIANARVISFAANQPTIETPSAGSIEMWSQCYDEGVSGLFDENDDWGGAPGCYGSLQVHVAGATAFSFNAWTNEGTFEMGFGRAPTGHPDWTFHNNAGQYGTRRLEVFVRP